MMEISLLIKMSNIDKRRVEDLEALFTLFKSYDNMSNEELGEVEFLKALYEINKLTYKEDEAK